MRGSSLQASHRHHFSKLILETWSLTELVCSQDCLWKALLPEWNGKVEMSGAEGTWLALGRAKRCHSHAMGFGDRARKQVFRINTLTIVDLGFIK